jgi:hypothetical protein
MKKWFSILMAVTMLLALTGPAMANDVQQVTYSSGYQVQNLNASAAAAITITYYPQTGDPVEVQDTIPAGGSVTYASIAIHLPDATYPSFNGSVVVSSDQPVAAIANTLGNPSTLEFAAATGGFSAGATSVSLPLIMCGNYGFDTWFNIQNAGAADATVTINYVPGVAGSAASDSATIGVGRAVTFDQAAGSSTASCTHASQNLGDRFVGSATITSDQPVVATVMQLNASTFPVLMGYNGFTGGATSVSAPLVMANNAGFYTGIQVQNTGSAETTVTVAYAANTVGTTKPADDVFALGAGASATLIQAGAPPANGSTVNDYSTLGRYVGAATISANQPLVAIVNQTHPGAGLPHALGTAYEGFAADGATAKVSVPLVMAYNPNASVNFYTGIQVQNVDTAAVDVTITFGPNSASGGTPGDITFSLQPGASATYIQQATDLAGNDWTTIGPYVGSAAITANGKIVAIVNEASFAFAGDQFYTFDAFNY